MSRPRVLFLTTSYPTDERPAVGIFVREHARSVAARWDVAVIHLERRDDVIWGFHIQQVVDHSIPVWHVRYPSRPLALSVAFHFAGALAAYRAVRRGGFDPDILHAHFFLAAGPAAVIGLIHRKRFVATEQWTIFLTEDPGELSRPMRLAARAALRRAAAILPVSTDLAEAMCDAGIRGNYRVIPNAVDVALFRPEGELGGKKRLLTVGQLGPQKGVDVLLQALVSVPGDVTLDIVGDGPERSQCEALAAQFGLQGRVRFHGLQPKELIAELMRKAALFVLASRFDNNPCVLVEAQASGLPIVSTRVGGIPEIVGQYGILVERDDPHALARAIRESLASLQEMDVGAIAASARSRYSLEAVGGALSDVYDDVLRDRH